ncbi:MAG: HAD family hydrolase [bacterium]
MMKGAIFDVDGTMFDTERLYRDAWMDLAPKYGFRAHPDYPEAVRGSSGERAREVALAYYPGIDVDDFFDSCRAKVYASLYKEVPLKPGIREILDYFSGHGFRLAIASAGRYSKIMYCLKATGFERYFETVVAGRDVRESKPAPEVFLLAAKRLGLSPKDCYVLEDCRNGVIGASAAGCATIMVPDVGEDPVEEVRRLCVGVYPDLLAVKAALEAGEI